MPLLSTPPPLIHDRSPYARIDLPPMTSIPVTIHPLLRYEPTSYIEYSLLFLPLSATPTTPHLTQQQWLQEPATYPNLPSLIIRATWQERVIVVFPSEGSYGFVTVENVLDAVHAALRAKARDLHANTHYKLNNSALFYHQKQRVAMQPDEGAIRLLIMKLVQGRTAWRGLSPSTAEVDVWLLQIQ